MIEISIPGYRTLRLASLVLDYNGTLARDGQLLPGVADALNELSAQIGIYVVTADTFGTAADALAEVSCEMKILPPGSQDVEKLRYVKQMGAETAVCIGNGRNDRLMLKEAALSIVVVQTEGAAMETMLTADIVCSDIVSALGLLRRPKRLVATLRV